MKRSRLRDIASPIALMVLVLAAWEAAVHLFRIQRYVLPPPSMVARSLFNDGPRVIFPQLGVTLVEILAGYFLAIPSPSFSACSSSTGPPSAGAYCR
jgi:NitT/TauT family transport system permease protein